MSGLKTKAMPKKVCASGTLKVMQRLNEYEFGVELWVMREDENRNKWSYQNLAEYYKTFVGQPILVAYVGQVVGDGHNMAKRRDPETGEEYYSFMDGTAERIVGTLSEDERDFTLVERDGHTWLKAKGRLFEFYAPELVEKIRRQGTMEVSAETNVTESHKEGDVDVFTKWTGLGVTILGDRVSPAIPGASIAKLAAMQEEFKSLKLKAASLHTAAEGSGKINKKGLKRSMNKQMMESVQTKFPNHKLIALSEDGMSVGLLDASGNLFSYTFNAEDNGEVMESRIAPCAAHIVLSAGEVELNADVADVVAYTVSAAKTENGEIKQLSEELNATKEQIRAMQGYTLDQLKTLGIERVCDSVGGGRLGRAAEAHGDAELRVLLKAQRMVGTDLHPLDAAQARDEVPQRAQIGIRVVQPRHERTANPEPRARRVEATEVREDLRVPGAR